MAVEIQQLETTGNQSVPISFLRANYTYQCKLQGKEFVRDARDVLAQLGQTQEALAHFQDVIQHMPLVPHVNGQHVLRQDIAACLRACIDQAIVLAYAED